MTIEQQLERRIIAALVIEPVMWFAFEHLEMLDFNDFRCRIWFIAIRWLQARGDVVTVDAIMDRIEATDAQTERHQAEHANAAWLGEAIHRSARYRVPALANLDASLLRAISGADGAREQVAA